MNAEEKSDLARVRDARMRISEDFHHDPDLLVKHYMELQQRHKERLVVSREAASQQLRDNANQ